MENLRKHMKKLNIPCLLITSNDFNLSEYVNDYFKAREYYSGFSGSAGSLVITYDEAYLFTDGRYFIQAERELKCGIKLKKIGIDEDLDDFLNKFDLIGADLRTIPTKMGLKHNFIHCPFIFDEFKRKDIIYSEHILLDDSISGCSHIEKISKVRSFIKEKNATSYSITKLDEICYILNIRGYDIKYSMLNYGYLIINLNETIFFTDKNISIKNVTVKKIDEFYDYIKNTNDLTLLDYSSTNYYIYKLIKNKININSYINLIKSIKNETEIFNTKKALLKDSSIMIRFIDYVKNNYLKLSENSAKKYLDNLRLNDSDILDLSFETISAYNESGAMLHYNGMDDLALNDGFLLVDSGAQYKYGTTDITRTILLGKVNDEFKKYYTYTLKSLINLSTHKFILGTTGDKLDYLSRSVINNIYLDYRCGTGHGVGYISNVHEGPNSFRKINDQIILPNMITTIEPGIYLEKSVGIRLENMVLSKEKLTNELDRKSVV